VDKNLIQFLHIQWERNCINLPNCSFSTSYLDITKYLAVHCPDDKYPILAMTVILSLWYQVSTIFEDQAALYPVGYVPVGNEGGASGWLFIFFWCLR
jgi:hypothetical protein